MASEFVTSFIPESWSNDDYMMVHFYSEDLSTIFLALACYTALSYTSVILKGVSLTAIVVSTGLMLSNIMIDVFELPQTTSTAMMVCFIFVLLQLFMTRFLFRIDHKSFPPDPDTIYMVITKPRNFIGMLGLIWSGLGGGFSAYVNGDCYWFSKKAGKLIKTTDQEWCKGRQMIDCGPATEEKIADLESLVGVKWSIWNNCFTVFSCWRRRWDGK